MGRIKDFTKRWIKEIAIALLLAIVAAFIVDPFNV
jgi:hypothetical protein